jgi:CHAT domain-containing protein/Flp pilus assembly protein TadD
MIRDITKVFVRFASVALIPAIVQLSLISPPSVQTISAQTSGEAQTLVEKIEELKNSGRHREAIPLQQRLLAITEMALGPDHLDVARSLNNLARLYGHQGRYADAEALYKRGLAIREKALGPNHPDVATVLDNLAELYGAQGRYADAELLYKRALAIREESLGSNHPDTAMSLDNLRWLYQAQGRYADAGALYGGIIEGTYEGTFTISQATGEYQMSLTFQQFGPEVIVTYRSALGGRGSGKTTIAGNVLTVPLRSVGGCWGSYTASFKFSGDTVSWTYSGQDCQGPAQGRGIAKKLDFMSPLASEAEELTHQAYALYQIGKYAEAIPLAQQVLAIREKLVGPEHPDVAKVLAGFGELYDKQGRYDEAEPLYKRTLVIFEKAVGPDHFHVAESLTSLASLYDHQGRYAEAEPLFKRALVIFEKAHGSDYPAVAGLLNTLAALYDKQGRYDEAEPLYKRAQAIWEKALGSDVAEQALLRNLAAHYYRQGRYDEAEPLLKRALAIFEKFLGPDHFLVANLLNDLAVLYLRQARYNNALPLVERMISSGFALKQVALPVLMNSQVTGQIQTDRVFDDSLNVIQHASQTAAAEALNNLNARLSTGNDRLAQLVRKDQDLAAETERLNKAIVEAVSKEPSKRDSIAEQRIKNRLDEASKERNDLQQIFVRDFPNYVSLSKPEPLTTKEIQSLLDNDDALVVIDLGDKSYVWVVTKDRVDWKEVQLPATQASKTIETLRAALNPNPDSPKVTFDRGLAYQLYRQLLGPIESIISQKTRLSFVLDGALTSLPPQVLLMSDPEGKDLASLDWVVRKYAITILPSVASLQVLRGGKAVTIAAKPMIGFGDPIFDRAPQTNPAQAGALNRSLTTFYRGVTADTQALAKALLPLPETADELRAIAKTLKASPEDIKLGDAASVTTVKRELLDNYRVVYFATHALVAGQVEQFAKVKAEPSLVLSIPEKPSEDDDGLLRASDVATLKLNADFVVLSACSTAAGDKPGAEALSGLARAFFYAGAKSLIVSHWDVDSDSAVDLMTGLFDALRKNPHVSHAEALRASMLRMISKGPYWAQPKLWAPFIVVGEPRNE